MITTRSNLAAFLSLTLLCLAAAAGCANEKENAEVECSSTFYGADRGPCKVTFTRETASTASVLGRDVELLKTEAERVTLKVANAEITVSKQDTEAQEANLNITVEAIAEQKVTIRFSEVAV